MSSINKSKIENLSSNKGLIFYNAFITTDNVTINYISIANPTGDSSKNYSRNWGGFKRLISINLILFDDGTDKSISGDNIIKLSEQRNYLNQPDGVIQSKSPTDNISDIFYRVTVYEDGVEKVYIGSIEDINVDSSPDNTNQLKGMLQMFESNPN